MPLLPPPLPIIYHVPDAVDVDRCPQKGLFIHYYRLLVYVVVRQKSKQKKKPHRLVFTTGRCLFVIHAPRPIPIYYHRDIAVQIRWYGILGTSTVIIIIYYKQFIYVGIYSFGHDHCKIRGGKRLAKKRKPFGPKEKKIVWKVAWKIGHSFLSTNRYNIVRR